MCIRDRAMHLVNKLYLTMVQFNGSGDVFFPQIDYDEWSLISDEKHTSDDKNNYDYSFLIYKRK